jgi:GT2 family glycosyltransferase
MGKISKLFRLLGQINIRNIRRTVTYIRKYGIRGLRRKIISAAVDPLHYNEWFGRHRVSAEEVEAQRLEEKQFSYRPLISIAVPLYHTPLQALKEMVESVQAQSYSKWELCLADGSGGDREPGIGPECEAYLGALTGTDTRIRCQHLSQNGGIASNTNAAIGMAHGEYIALLDHDDFLEPDALFQIVKAMQQEPADMLYTDEDKYDEKKKEFAEPNMKPDFNLDLLRSYNYITHFLVLRRGLLDKIGLLDASYDGAQDYDLILRAAEEAEKIRHIPKVLYHWRMCAGSTAENPASKQYCYDAGQRAIEAHLKRCHAGASVRQMDMPGVYHTTYEVAGNPLVSIIIPNKDHIADLIACISSIQDKSTYQNIEFVVVENNSTDPATFAAYKEIQTRWKNVSVVTWDGHFNFSAINNYGIAQAKGEYLLLLNNDVTMLSADAIGEMLGNCMRPEVGIVGARLLFPNGKVQHAGIVVGFGGFAGHVFVDLPGVDYGYMRRARVNCDYSAVTAACLMVKRSVYEEVGGLTESFAVALNDVDFCLKVRRTGKLVVYNAFAEWYHFESKSRGYEDTPEKKARFEQEIARFQERWSDILRDGDPYYNPNFPTELAPFTLD